MLRILKVMGVAAATTVLSAVAVPAATAGALSDIGVWITYQGVNQSRGWVAVRTGSSFLLTAEPNTDKPLMYSWNVDPEPGVGGAVSSLAASKIRLECRAEGNMVVTVTATDEDGGDDAFDEVTIYCQDLPTAEIDPQPPVPGERQRIPLGTTITFRSLNWRSSLYDSEWRTTGVAGVAYGQKFTRTFDQVGNFGVELTDQNEVGRSKTWVGYTVIGPPTALVSPAPASGALEVSVGETVTFDGSRSLSPGGGALTYEWRTAGVSDIAAQSATYSRKFDRAGDFTVDLKVVDEFGQSATRSVLVRVTKYEPPVVVVTPAPANPKARMTVRVGSLVKFDARRSNDPDGGAVKFQWRTTGERGVVATSSTYSRRFSKVGLYGVEVTVIDDEGQYRKRWVGLNVVP